VGRLHCCDRRMGFAARISMVHKSTVKVIYRVTSALSGTCFGHGSDKHPVSLPVAAACSDRLDRCRLTNKKSEERPADNGWVKSRRLIGVRTRATIHWMRHGSLKSLFKQCSSQVDTELTRVRSTSISLLHLLRNRPLYSSVTLR
jgi:hypothetical protein